MSIIKKKEKCKSLKRELDFRGALCRFVPEHSLQRPSSGLRVRVYCGNVDCSTTLDLHQRITNCLWRISARAASSRGTTIDRLALPYPAVAVTTADQAEISLKQTVTLSEESRFSVLWLGISPLKISLWTSVPFKNVHDVEK